jgi:hypothetical protein
MSKLSTSDHPCRLVPALGIRSKIGPASRTVYDQLTISWWHTLFVGDEMSITAEILLGICALLVLVSLRFCARDEPARPSKLVAENRQEK